MSFTDITKTWLRENDYDINDLNKQGKYGNSAVMKAAREGKVDIVKELIGKGVNLDIKNVDGNSALWNACFASSYECFYALIDGGIDINSKNDNGVTALMYCASAGKEDFVKLLLENSADATLENLDGFKAIDLAVTPKIFKMLKNATLSR
ncbi:ankyrin repeat domain-containing protein [Halarcobacter anaerophilus]|uniref:Ankyrin repeat domain-containing protein n=1 Tax=Halarcobacter anaerophilus TaxID=877500 RepID=A0A4Q0Y6B2_9BACT|nr:ankyrin repeat domain-containing protein [Halarcobacter anaerophilus]QDF27610.1 ankyrin domain-containing protein [Halarcobacter anaerophilus]RXJ63961.1 ankyrin repeat domain-containing protein [Halarcobacter anaerophilus]